jgi:hypothetical protein
MMQVIRSVDAMVFLIGPLKTLIPQP